MKNVNYLKTSAVSLSLGVAILGLSACDVDKTREGETPDVDVKADAGQLPKYDVEVTKTQEGEMPSVDVDVEGGQMPAYEVEGPDVEVGTKEIEVTVPDVSVEMPGDPDNPDPDNND